MGHNGLISDPFWALLGLEMGSFLTFRNPGNPEIPDSGPPDLWIAGSRSLDPSASHRADAVSRYVHTMVSIIPIHHGSKGHVWGCCGLYVYIYQQQKTPFWGLLKRHYGIGISPSSRWRWSPGSHLVISTMMDIMQVPLWPMVYAICLHGMYSIWYYGYMHNGISPIRMLQME